MEKQQIERIAQRVANAMQRARDECGGDAIAFAYAEAAMRSELRAALQDGSVGG